MAPRLGAKYPIDIETISKPRKEYMSPEYMELDLPKAPSVMVGEEVVVVGADIEEHKLEGPEGGLSSLFRIFFYPLSYLS